MNCLKCGVFAIGLVAWCGEVESYDLGYTRASGSSLPIYNASSDIKIFAADFLGSGQSGIIHISKSDQKFGTLYRESVNSSSPWLRFHHNMVDWTIRTDDIYVVGDFNADGKDDLLAANPNGIYSAYTSIPLSPSSPSTFSRYLYKTNGDIGSNDKLVSGDFTGNGQDEVLMVKPDGRYFTMQYREWTNSNGNYFNEFNILESGTSPMYWWNISANDQYIVGDYNGDGKDDVMAINPNGWAHIMTFNNGQWEYYAGLSGGVIGTANIGINDHYSSGDFDGDGKDEIILTNSNHPWALALELNGTQWQTYKHNNGTNNLASSYRPYLLQPTTQVISGRFFGANGARDNVFLYDVTHQNTWHVLNL